MVRTKNLKGYSDVHHTTPGVAKRVIEHFNPTLPCLEPCRGTGVFYDQLPPGTDWCEITEGRDFFEYTAPVDWIVTNPPFGDLTRWLEHSFEVAQNIVFVIPLSKLFSSAPRLEIVRSYGSVRELLYLGRGRSIGFDIGFPFAGIHFVKGRSCDTKWTWASERFPPEESDG